MEISLKTGIEHRFSSSEVKSPVKLHVLFGKTKEFHNWGLFGRRNFRKIPCRSNSKEIHQRGRGGGGGHLFLVLSLAVTENLELIT